MEQKSAHISTDDDFCESLIESAVKWLSCNGEVLGLGPTLVFASAAALFLYHELEKAVGVATDHSQVSMLEKTLVFTMVTGMLALMIHIWVCATRFFQYYLDTIIKDSPNLLLEMTTAGILKGQSSEFVLLAPLIKFLRQQQPQIHITTCWFVALCYADYVRKHYCNRFNMPYLEQWQMDLQDRASQGVKCTVQKVNSLVGSLHQKLRGLSQPLLSSSRTEMSTSLSYVRTARVPDERCATEAQCGSQPCGSAHTETVANCVHIINAHDKPPDPIDKLLEYIKLKEWAKCGESEISTVPTMLWAAGSALLAHRLLHALFRRSLFRRVQLWETAVQYLLFMWMVIYSLHFWVLCVRLVKIVINLCYQDEHLVADDVNVKKFMAQWVIWMFGAAPLAFYIHTRPRPEAPPLMIWITTNHWQRREMGPYGYYLSRPLQPHQSTAALNLYQQARILRRACSDTNIYIKQQTKKRRHHSKSI